MKIQQSNEPFAVIGNEAVQHFMKNDVIDALGRLLRQLKIEPDVAQARIAAAPLRFHLLNEGALDADAQAPFPFSDQWLQRGFYLRAIPRF